jgi:RimJ/RimL family protein N-acetyltransferase
MTFGSANIPSSLFKKGTMDLKSTAIWSKAKHIGRNFMNNFITIATDRLLLRKLEIKDRDNFFRYRSLPEVYKYQSFMPKNVTEVDDFIRNNHSNPNIPNTWFQLAIIKRDEDVLIGDIGIHFLEDNDQVEVGYP